MRSLSALPCNLYIGITDRCNASCIICWRQKAQPPFLDMADAVLDRLQCVINVDNAVDFVGWWGDGEFFSYGRLDQLLEFMASTAKTQHSFSTNGIQLASYAERLARIDFAEIHISIDGATEETLSRIRRGVKLSDITDGVAALYSEFDAVNKRRPAVMFTFTSMVSNICELPDLVVLAAELEIPVIHVNPLSVLHSDLESESLSVVAPGLELRYYTEAKLRAEELGVDLRHCSPAVMEVDDD